MKFWEDAGNRAAFWTLVVLMPVVLSVNMLRAYRDPSWRQPARRDKLRG